MEDRHMRRSLSLWAELGEAVLWGICALLYMLLLAWLDSPGAGAPCG